jgi:hypothetical protein
MFKITKRLIIFDIIGFLKLNLKDLSSGLKNIKYF